jgi:hypothetical protein
MLRGKVVPVDFWEYTCINWIRTVPYVKASHRDYGDVGLVVVGVHAPEFEFGKHAENIDRGIRDHGLTYPIALDNDFATWRTFGSDVTATARALRGRPGGMWQWRVSSRRVSRAIATLGSPCSGQGNVDGLQAILTMLVISNGSERLSRMTMNSLLSGSPGNRPELKG